MKIYLIRCVFFLLFAFVILFTLGCRDGIAEIPFIYEKNIYLKYMVNDTIESYFMFDTGAYGIYPDSFFLKKNNLPPEIKGFKLKNKNMIYSSNSGYVLNVKTSFGMRGDGIVGWDLFRNKAIRINYKERKLTVLKKIDKSDNSLIKLTCRNNRFYLPVEIKINNKLSIKGEYLLDTGFGGCIYITGGSNSKLRLDTINNSKIKFSNTWGLLKNKESTGFIMRVQNIKISNVTIAEPLIEVSTDSTGVLGNVEYTGILGNRFLENYIVIIDFLNKELYLSANDNYQSRMKYRTAGFGFINRADIFGGLMITRINIGSESDTKGIKYGDIITHIDNHKITKDSDSIVKRTFSKSNQQHKFTFSRQDSIFNVQMTIKELL